VTKSSKNDIVGYRRPPKSTRWQKGQSGNPRTKAKPKQTESRLAVIERALLRPVDIEKDGIPTRMPVLEAITLQLLQKSLKGNRKAQRTLQEFSEAAERNSVPQFEILFVDNEYTKAFAGSRDDRDV
jgi:hypothetical protein